MNTPIHVLVRFPSLTSYQRYTAICGTTADCRLAKGGSVICSVRNNTDLLCCAVNCGATFRTRRTIHD